MRLYLKPNARLVKSKNGAQDQFMGLPVYDADAVPYVFLEIPRGMDLPAELAATTKFVSLLHHVTDHGQGLQQRRCGKYSYRTAQGEVTHQAGPGRQEFVVCAPVIDDAIALMDLLREGKIAPDTAFDVKQVQRPIDNVREALHNLIESVAHWLDKKRTSFC